MRWFTERLKILCGFSLALSITGLANFFAHQNTLRSIENTARVQQARTVLDTLEDLFAALLDSESARRGYIISGSRSELNRYYRAIEGIAPKLARLEGWFADNPVERGRIEELRALVSRRIVLAERSILLYQQNPTAREQQARWLIANENIRLAVRQIIERMKRDERQRLHAWIDRSRESIRDGQRAELFSLCLGIAVLFATFALLYWQTIERERAEILQYKLAKEKELGDLKLRFFSLVSHEFRTPLSVILGSIHLLTERGQGWTEEKRQKNLQRVQSSARTMTRLLTDILTLTRAEAGKLDFRPEWIEVESFCLNLISDFEALGELDRPIEFSSDNPGYYARLDEKLLQSILGNLLSNAIKYSSPKKPVHFRLSCQPETVIFQIQDSGCGIPPESLLALYEPFYRAPNAREIAGTGLGLAVVKQCLELHRGEISVESEVGTGTIFTVRIKRERDENKNTISPSDSR